MEIIKNRTDATNAEANGSVLSYEYKQSGFSIDLKNSSVRLFNKELNIFSVNSYCDIREISYSLPANEFEHAQLYILVDDALNHSWKFNVQANAHTQEFCEQWLDIFNTHIFQY